MADREFVAPDNERDDLLVRGDSDAEQPPGVLRGDDLLAPMSPALAEVHREIARAYVDAIAAKIDREVMRGAAGG